MATSDDQSLLKTGNIRGVTTSSGKQVHLAWVILAVALALAATLWVLGTRPTSSGAEKIFGNGTGTFTRSEAQTNWFLAGGGIALGLSGCAVWALLLARRERTPALVTVVSIVSVGVVAAAAWGVLDRIQADDLTPGLGPRYETIEDVVEALEGSSVECADVTAQATSSPYFRGSRGVCEVERRLAPDGRETVSILFWRSPGARTDWYENVATADVVSVDGPTWLITCRFETTCSQIQILTGGRTR
jgi:hypothetical protein